MASKKTLVNLTLVVNELVYNTDDLDNTRSAVSRYSRKPSFVYNARAPLL